MHDSWVTGGDADPQSFLAMQAGHPSGELHPDPDPLVIGKDDDSGESSMAMLAEDRNRGGEGDRDLAVADGIDPYPEVASRGPGE